MINLWTLQGFNKKKTSKKKITNKSRFRNFFTNRVVLKWNSLPSDIVEAKSLNEFKNKFDALNKDIMYATDIHYFD